MRQQIHVVVVLRLAKMMVFMISPSPLCHPERRRHSQRMMPQSKDPCAANSC